MSARQNVMITTGTMILVIVGMLYSYYGQSISNNNVEEIRRLLLEGRQIGNMRGNATLGAVGEAIQEIKAFDSEISHNLTAHRLVANDTNADLQRLISQFNQTNEEERGKAVDEIINAIGNNTKLLEQILAKD